MIVPIVETVSVDLIVKDPANWVGKNIKVAGVFSGWKGKCVGGPPVLRSDWMIESGAACMYVSGRLPTELSAIPPTRGFSEPVIVEGEVVIDKSGRAYIMSTRVTLR